MLKSDVDELKKIARRYSLYFLVVGVIGILFSADENGDGRIKLLEILDELLIISIGTVGLLTIGDYPEYAKYYTSLLSLHTIFVGISYFGTAFITLLITIFFPNCDDDTDPDCAAEKDSAAALIGILVFGLVLEFIILLFSVYGLKNARALQEALN